MYVRLFIIIALSVELISALWAVSAVSDVWVRLFRLFYTEIQESCVQQDGICPLYLDVSHLPRVRAVGTTSLRPPCLAITILNVWP